MQLPITTKRAVSSSQQPGPLPSRSPPHEDPSMAASPPCVIPCCAAEWPQLDMYACMPLPQQQQQQQQLPPQQQSHHAMQQQHKQQQQCWSHGSRHSSSGQAAQASTPHQHANHAGMIAHGYCDRGEDELNSPMCLAAQHEQHEHQGQTSASRALPSTQEATGTHLVPGRQQGTGRAQQEEQSMRQGSCTQQETQGTLGREGTVPGEGIAMAQASSRPFLDGLRPCSPSQRCTPEAAAQASHLLPGRLHLNKGWALLLTFYVGPAQSYRTWQWLREGVQHFVFVVLQKIRASITCSSHAHPTGHYSLSSQVSSKICLK